MEKEKLPIDFVHGVEVAVYWRQLVSRLDMLFFGQRREKMKLMLTVRLVLVRLGHCHL